MAELTIEEARKIYASADTFKDLMLTKFTKSELEESEVSQSEFDNVFLKILGKCDKTVFLDRNGVISTLPTNRMVLRNADDQWMFDIQFTGENKHFWVNRYRIGDILVNKFNLQVVDIQRLMKNQMRIRFGLDDVTPCIDDIVFLDTMKIVFGL